VELGVEVGGQGRKIRSGRINGHVICIIMQMVSSARLARAPLPSRTSTCL
jgi:hypothetical protein